MSIGLKFRLLLDCVKICESGVLLVLLPFLDAEISRGSGERLLFDDSLFERLVEVKKLEEDFFSARVGLV
jgi:hypothetical protein